jgi:PIN domain nuclease of toxin-antitoxin system
VRDLVLDASALLAMLNGEPGQERVAGSLPSSCISAANLAEVVAGLINRGLPADRARQTTQALTIDTVPLERDQALLAGVLREATRQFGLSLGDRCCLALALTLGLPVLTTDRDWAHLDLGVDVRVIR